MPLSEQLKKLPPNQNQPENPSSQKSGTVPETDLPGAKPEFFENKPTDPERKKKKPGRGRPRGSARDQPRGEDGHFAEKPIPFVPYAVVPKDLCELIATVVPFMVLSIVIGNKKFKLTPDEAEKLAPYWDRVIQKYLPAALARWKDEAALLTMICITLIGKSPIPGMVSHGTETAKN